MALTPVSRSAASRICSRFHFTPSTHDSPGGGSPIGSGSALAAGPGGQKDAFLPRSRRMVAFVTASTSLVVRAAAVSSRSLIGEPGTGGLAAAAAAAGRARCWQWPSSHLGTSISTISKTKSCHAANASPTSRALHRRTAALRVAREGAGGRDG